ncbi:hypothetical protein IQ25_04181 [Novosphingobium taihuense]|nr:hypothetical protein IQ25_04181 [Novosphingobium taihuense]
MPTRGSQVCLPLGAPCKNLMFSTYRTLVRVSPRTSQKLRCARLPSTSLVRLLRACATRPVRRLGGGSSAFGDCRGAKTADHVVEPDTCFHQMSPCGDHAADPMRCRRFDAHLLVEAVACQMCKVGSIVRIGLVRLQDLMCLPCVNAHHCNTQFTQAQADGRRLAVCFDYGCFLPSGFDNQKCAPPPGSEGSSHNYMMTDLCRYSAVETAIAVSRQQVVLRKGQPPNLT